MPSPSKKRLLLNLGLLALVTALMVFVIYRKPPAIELHKTLYDQNIGEEASEIYIHADGKEDTLLKNEDGVWKVLKPTQFIADEDKVRHLFTLLSENADTSYDVEGKDLALYGLEQERLSVSFNGVKLTFGKLNEISQQRYILKDKKMYLISETVSGLLESGANAFKVSDVNPSDTTTKKAIENNN